MQGKTWNLAVNRLYLMYYELILSLTGNIDGKYQNFITNLLLPMENFGETYDGCGKARNSFNCKY